MPYNKKSQGIALNVVVIAAILLLVLVVLSVMFTRKMGGFTKELGACRGDCIEESECRVIAPEGHDPCDDPLTPTATGGVRISLSGRSVCCLVAK